MLSKKNQTLIIIFIFGILMLNYPLIGIANKKMWILGIPLLYWYLILVWLLLILLIVRVMIKAAKDRNE